jgi:hypothetical protein
MAIQDKVILRIPKGEDAEIHVKRTTAAGVTMYQIRDFVPSTGRYGRGIVIPPTALADLFSRGAVLLDRGLE